jgi:hypothetical protein
MRVAALRSLLKSIAQTVSAAGGRQAATDIERMCEALDTFESLSVSQFADFLAKADHYLKEGKFRLPGQGAKKAVEVNGDRVKQAAQSILELYERSISDEVQYESIALEVSKLDLLSKDEVAQVAREVGILRRMPTKAAALDEIRQMIEQRKESFQRTAF